jgi:hypothetical protein
MLLAAQSGHVQRVRPFSRSIAQLNNRDSAGPSAAPGWIPHS